MMKVYYGYDFKRVKQLINLKIVRTDNPIAKNEWQKIKIGGVK